MTDIVAALWSEFSWTTTWIYQQLNGNPVAAMPSLHAAYPALLYLFLRERWRRVALLMVGWSVAVWFSIAYLGHHYLVGAIVGVAYALVAYLVTRWLWRRSRAPVGIRQDAWANAHRIETEVAKTGEAKGRSLHAVEGGRAASEGQDSSTPTWWRPPMA